ncbi:MAG: sigma-54-dependent Fis family transcriptional regulator [Nitrospiraceae bacterium]
MRRGAYDYILKPVNAMDLSMRLHRAIRISEILRRNSAFERIMRQDMQAGSLVGTSDAFKRIMRRIREAAQVRSTVLITGETGTGKGLIARAIHEQSREQGKPFQVIDCATIPEGMVESELFGHEKGAFTGAHVQRKGRIESAQGGTLFLDEIGELPLLLQVKLLRFLQEQRIERVGGRESIAVDTRIVAATNANLTEAMERGGFRKDLFYRLSVVQIRVPPLREREEDRVLLAQAFMLRYRDELNARVTSISDEARAAIQAYHWPGNVRELENRIKRAVVMAYGTILQPADLELAPGPSPAPYMTLREARSQLEKSLIRQALIRTNGNVTRAAEELGISRQALHESMHKYGLDKHRSWQSEVQ